MTTPEILDWLARRGSARNVAGMSRYGIRSNKVFGVSMSTMRPLAKRLGRNHRLALSLWKSGWLEARLLATLIGEPSRVTVTQMHAWARQFDNWAVCDGACIHLFSRTPHAWRMVETWAAADAEYVKRAGFALMAALAVRDKTAGDARFRRLFRVIEREARDERHVVSKAVNWALRQIGKRNGSLNASAIRVATRLAARPDRASRWVGRDALRELQARQPGLRRTTSSSRRGRP
jgi:3-methyladenine DNA glycosylase AlkD